MNENIKKNGIKYGIISGVVSILYTLSLYLIDYKLFINVWLGFALLFVFIIIGCVQLIELRKELGGLMTLKEGFTGYFVAGLIALCISTLFSLLLFNVIDTDVRDLANEELITFQVKNLENYNVPTSKIKETVINMKETPQFSTNGILKSSIGSLIGSIIFGLILAAIFKRKPKDIF